MTTNNTEVFEVYRTRQGTLESMVLLADYEALQSECEKLRKVADQYQRLIELGEDFHWENIIRVDISDFPSRADAIDAAMQETLHDS